MGRLCLALALFAAPCWAQTAVRGIVRDAASEEPLGRVRVEAAERGLRAVTDSSGRFELAGAAPGPLRLRFSGVGYRPADLELEVETGAAVEVAVSLHPDSLRRTESVSVTAGPYGHELPGAVSLAGNELRNLASVLTDDPLRAVQGLPGVAAGDDFQSQFALRGAPFQRVGLYLDGVLLRSPFHTVQGDINNPSVTVLNGEMLESVNLLPGAPPSSYYDRTAGAVDLRSREGDRESFGFRVTASMSNLAGTFEGPLGKRGRGSWLLSARKSYLQYILRAVSDDDELAFGFSDVQSRLSYDLSPKHTVSLGLVDGRSGLGRTGDFRDEGPNADIESDLHFTLARLGSRYAPRSNLLVENRVAYLRERFENLGRALLPLAEDFYAEWVGSGDLSWQAHRSFSLDAGWLARNRREDGYFVRRSGPDNIALVTDEFRGSGTLGGGYLQQSTQLFDGRLRMRTGARFDRNSTNQTATAAPFASASVFARRSTELHAEWGQAVQHPELSLALSRFVGSSLDPARSNHLRALVEQKLPARARLRAEVFHRWDRDLVARPLVEPRLLDGAFVPPAFNAPYQNALKSYTRGFQLFLQRRSANGLNGWASYAWTRSETSDGVLGIRYPSDYDQRHTVNLFGSYRPAPRLNLSAKLAHGSSLPLPGFFLQTGETQLALDEVRNRVRLPYYQRLDLRINKLLVFGDWQVTLFGEVINVLNRRNIRTNFQGGFNPITGNRVPDLEDTFPILPSVGVVIEF